MVIALRSPDHRTDRHDSQHHADHDRVRSRGLRRAAGGHRHDDDRQHRAGHLGRLHVPLPGLLPERDEEGQDGD